MVVTKKRRRRAHKAILLETFEKTLDKLLQAEKDLYYHEGTDTPIRDAVQEKRDMLYEELMGTIQLLM